MLHTSVKGFYDELLTSNKRILETLADEVHDYMCDYITRNLYNARIPEEYERTRNYLDSVIVTNIVKLKRGWKIRVTYDTTKIIPIEREGTWNAHRAFKKKRGKVGRDVSKWIPQILEEGNGNNPVYKHEGIFASENVTESKFEAVVNKAVKELKKKGIAVSYIRM